VNNELEWLWKEAVIAFFKVISRELPRRPEEEHENANMSFATSQSVLQLVTLHTEAERYTA